MICAPGCSRDFIAIGSFTRCTDRGRSNLSGRKSWRWTSPIFMWGSCTARYGLSPWARRVRIRPSRAISSNPTLPWDGIGRQARRRRQRASFITYCAADSALIERVSRAVAEADGSDAEEIAEQLRLFAEPFVDQIIRNNYGLTARTLQ